MEDKMEKKLKELLDCLIDERVDTYGVLPTVEFLIDFGLTDDQIVDLGFNRQYVRLVRTDDISGI